MAKFTSTTLVDDQDGSKALLDLLDKVNTIDTDASESIDSVNTTLTERIAELEAELERQSYKGIFQAQHTVAPGVASGTVSAGAWRTGPLTSVAHNDIDGASLNSNTITLPAGTYKVTGFRGVFYVNGYATRLYNITDSETLLIGMNGYADIGDGYNSEHIPIQGVITLTKTTEMQLQLYPQSSRSGDGWGFQTNTLGGLDRVWADILFERIKYAD